ncbi:hypothetical protein PaecuDRAFT_3552 [Paenibacillus curdlanolyticus YK9]|uniref:Uncharacterized protein n=1 Tax=Paenibacillus curdlanolyticus YK9 TaxID=717606 RepID=E0ID50_9BACL|nr:hypothetical protein [Paenibacillus curdlanolyticus]EFM09505.1 hypothetical protein PaecuDRAFT_3552 [Paenibacillus curdlanolyticus YK9]
MKYRITEFGNNPNITQPEVLKEIEIDSAFLKTLMQLMVGYDDTLKKLKNR